MTSTNAFTKQTDPRTMKILWREWYCLRPQERWHESMKIWQFCLQAGGALDPEPDPHSEGLK